jgi:hypothetical protein
VINELAEAETRPKYHNRKTGRGRKHTLEKKPDINEGFLIFLLRDHAAGDPMDETRKWTNLTCAKIGSLLAEEGFKVSRNIVRKLLKKNDFVKRKALKKKAAGGHVNRNAQFGRTLLVRFIYGCGQSCRQRG